MKFHYVNPVKSLMSLVQTNFSKPYFVKDAAKMYNSDNERLYNTPESTNWWIDTQVI